MTSYSKKLKLILFLIMLIASGVLLSVFISYRYVSHNQTIVIPVPDTNATISISGGHHVLVQEGIKEWSLDFKSGHFVSGENESVFQIDDLSVVFFLKDGKKSYLTAEQGVLNRDTNDFEVSGNVVVKNESYTLKTEKLQYKYNGRIIFTQLPVAISGDVMNLTAESMTFNLNTDETLFEGKVEGYLDENLPL